MNAGLLPDDVDGLERPWTAIGLVLALFALPVLAALPVEIGALEGDLVKWLLVLILVVIVVRFEEQPLSSIGLRRPRLIDAARILAIVVLGVGVFVITDSIVSNFGLPVRDGISRPSLAVGLFSAITAGVTEEVLFRGYPIERLTDAGYTPLLAGTITWGLFTVAHAPSYPAGTVLQIAVVAGLFTAVYVRTRSLFPVVIGHVLIDVVGVLAYFYT
ncbi:CPBP family intramembrane glutamic endopeptidase [Halovivax limisalsi]|uniref:CPBP family intramembrane glutamic endopeptidase n=1 Tax=Halovivax limisalsi TaxID=1453760 RepID=UPI001FFCEEA9|nr:type II CAAX endopeptidase family protein [Halovivax limisalsi]